MSTTTLPTRLPDRRTALAPFRFVGFWSAIVLPLVLVPMLLTGLASAYPVPFAALLAANLAAAVVGRDYREA